MVRLKTRNPDVKFREVMASENPLVWSVVEGSIDKPVEGDARQIPEYMKVTRVRKLRRRTPASLRNVDYFIEAGPEDSRDIWGVTVASRVDEIPSSKEELYSIAGLSIILDEARRNPRALNGLAGKLEAHRGYVHSHTSEIANNLQDIISTDLSVFAGTHDRQSRVDQLRSIYAMPEGCVLDPVIARLSLSNPALALSNLFPGLPVHKDKVDPRDLQEHILCECSTFHSFQELADGVQSVMAEAGISDISQGVRPMLASNVDGVMGLTYKGEWDTATDTEKHDVVAKFTGSNELDHPLTAYDNLVGAAIGDMLTEGNVRSFFHRQHIMGLPDDRLDMRFTMFFSSDILVHLNHDTPDREGYLQRLRTFMDGKQESRGYYFNLFTNEPIGYKNALHVFDKQEDLSRLMAVSNGYDTPTYLLRAYHHTFNRGKNTSPYFQSITQGDASSLVTDEEALSLRRDTQLEGAETVLEKLACIERFHDIEAARVCMLARSGVGVDVVCAEQEKLHDTTIQADVDVRVIPPMFLDAATEVNRELAIGDLNLLAGSYPNQQQAFEDFRFFAEEVDSRSWITRLTPLIARLCPLTLEDEDPNQALHTVVVFTEASDMNPSILVNHDSFIQYVVGLGEETAKAFGERLGSKSRWIPRDCEKYVENVNERIPEGDLPRASLKGLLLDWRVSANLSEYRTSADYWIDRLDSETTRDILAEMSSKGFAEVSSSKAYTDWSNELSDTLTSCLEEVFKEKYPGQEG